MEEYREIQPSKVKLNPTTKLSIDLIKFFTNYNITKDNKENTYYSFDGVIVERPDGSFEVYNNKIELMLDERRMVQENINKQLKDL